VKAYSGSEVWVERTPEEVVRGYLGTAAFHDKMARIFRASGRDADANSAENAARLCRENAAKVAA
jgi:hypothetical protein